MKLPGGRASARWLALVMALAASPVMAGCSTGPASGPLQSLTAGGQPVVDGAAVPVLAGQSADFTAFVYNPLHAPVTLVSAVPVLVPGTLPAHLAHVAVGTTINIIGEGRGWPPGISTKPLKGARIGHGQTNLIIGITGTTAGQNYAVAGVKITYQYQGDTYTVVAWSAGIACVSKIVRSTPSCDTADRTVVPKVEKMAES
jgi:hypothetical protein